MSSGPSRWRLNRLGRRFMWASMGVLAVAVIMIVIAAQQMFINDQDLGTLLWIMVPAAVAAALAAWLLSAPIARDAHLLSDAARRVTAGELGVRTGVDRNDELGDAAREFDRMTQRLAAVERERALMLSSISHDLRTPLAALRASVEAIRDGLADDPDAYLKGMERQVEALAGLVDDLRLHTSLTSGTMEMRRTRLDISELVDEAVESMLPLAGRAGVELRMDRGRCRTGAAGARPAQSDRERDSAQPLVRCRSCRRGTRPAGCRRDRERRRCGLPGPCSQCRVRGVHPR